MRCLSCDQPLPPAVTGEGARATVVVLAREEDAFGDASGVPALVEVVDELRIRRASREVLAVVGDHVFGFRASEGESLGEMVDLMRDILVLGRAPWPPEWGPVPEPLAKRVCLTRDGEGA